MTRALLEQALNALNSANLDLHADAVDAIRAYLAESEGGPMIDDSDRLKPCPFCGAEAAIVTLQDENAGAQCVQCMSSACGAASGLIYPLMDDVTDLLHERWNRRHDIRAHLARAVEAFHGIGGKP